MNTAEVQEIADVVATAIEKGRTRASPAAFAIIDIAWWHDNGQVTGVLASVEFVRGIVDAGLGAEEGIDLALYGDDAESHSAVGHLCRETTRLDFDDQLIDRIRRCVASDQERVGILATRLAAELAARTWTDIGLIVLVQAQDVYEDGDPLTPTRAALGGRALSRILTRLGSAPAAARNASPSTGVQAHEPGLAWAVLLEGGGTGESKLGGLPRLDSDYKWPTHAGRPLTHLATIVLEEVPRVQGTEILPETGNLAFFALLDELVEPIDPETRIRSAVRIIYSGVTTIGHCVTPDPGPVVLPERLIRFEPELQGHHCDGRDRPAEPNHQLLGHPTMTQGDPRHEGDVSLLHLGWDEPLQITHPGGGGMLVFGAAHRVRAMEWDRLTWWPTSS